MVNKVCLQECDYVSVAHDRFKKAAVEKNHLEGLTIWIGASTHDKTSIQTKNLYSCVFNALGIEVLECEFDAILCKRRHCDVLLMFTITPGTSARAIEVVVTSKFENQSLRDKLHIYMPDEYSEGYISKKLSDNLIAGKLYHKEKIYFDDLDKDIFSKCINNLIEIANAEKERLRITFEPSILIVTALSLEFTMMVDLLDEKRLDPSFGDDKSQFPHGVIGNKNVVVAMSGMGNNFSSAIASKVLEKYRSVKYVFMTGIAGGVPYLDNGNEHIRLGDVVVSNNKGVVQHDMGKSTVKTHGFFRGLFSNNAIENQFEYNFSPRPPNATLLKNTDIHIQNIGTGTYKYWGYLEGLSKQREFERPENMDLCDTPWIKHSTIEQPPLPAGYDPSKPRIHLGVIASGNAVIKNNKVRDKLKNDFKVKAIEMEASGVADAAWLDQKDYFVIRGICDYSNPDKNKEWQPYAAAAAAAFTREIIEETLCN